MCSWISMWCLIQDRVVVKRCMLFTPTEEGMMVIGIKDLRGERVIKAILCSSNIFSKKLAWFATSPRSLSMWEYHLFQSKYLWEMSWYRTFCIVWVFVAAYFLQRTVKLESIALIRVRSTDELIRTSLSNKGEVEEDHCLGFCFFFTPFCYEPWITLLSRSCILSK